jgi:hypothetical protein
MGLKMSLKDAALVRVNLFLDDRETLSQYSTSFSKDSIILKEVKFELIKSSSLVEDRIDDRISACKLAK